MRRRLHHTGNGACGVFGEGVRDARFVREFTLSPAGPLPPNGQRVVWDLSNIFITISTIYPGASPQLIQGFITTPIEQAVATAEGLDYVTSSSIQGVSTIQAYVRLNYDPNKAMTDVMAKVQQVKFLIPAAAQAALLALLGHLQTELTDLRQQVADLNSRLGQNSQNSSKPPSSDAPSVKRPPPREPSGRRRGAHSIE